MNLWTRTIWMSITLLLAALVVSGCDSEASEARDDSGDVAPRPVETLVVTPTDFVDSFEVMGTGEPLESVEVSSDVPGRILDAYVDAGDTVTAGASLFRIDTEADEAGQEVLETQVEAAERELNRLERLRDEGLATEQQIDNARTELESARKNLRQSQVSISRNVIRSPIAGHVANRIADSGEFANAGTPLIELIDYGTIVVEAQVPESEIRHIDIDEDSEFDIDFPALDTTAVGAVDRVALRPSPTSRTYTVELHVDNEDLSIRPGMRARVHFERERYEDVLVIPRDSILEGFDGREIMVVPGDEDSGRAVVREVVTGPGTRDDIVVLSGLDAGDRLILRGHRGLIGDGYVEIIAEHTQDGEEDS